MNGMPSRPSATARNRITLGVAGLILTAIVGFSYGQWRVYSRANADAARTRDIVATVDQLVFSLVDAETGQRGFLLTGQNRYLDPYNQGLRAVPTLLARLQSLLAPRSGQQPDLARLNSLVNQKLAELRQTIDLRRTQGAAPALAMVLSDEGKAEMDQIRALSRQIQGRENAVQGQASLEGEAAARTALLATLAGALVLLFFFAVGLEPFTRAGSDVRERSWLIRYGAAVLATAAAFVLRLALTAFIGRAEVSFSIFLMAVLFSAWFGGFRPGALSIMLSALLTDYYFTEPVGSFVMRTPADQVLLLIFVMVGFGMALLSDSQRRTLARANRAEGAERAERQRFETTLASIGDAVVATDVAGRVTFANQVALSLLGWPESEATGKHLDEIFRIVNEYSRAVVESPVAKALREGAVVGLANHTVLIARDGTEVPIDDSAAPIRDPAGTIQGTVLVFRDVTARRRAEQTGRLLASIVESSDDAILSQDLDGVITSWNLGARHIFGYTPEEMIGKPVSALAPPDRCNEMAEIVEHFRRGEATEHLQTVRQTKDGRRIDVSVTVSPLRDSAGRVTGASKIVRDITAQVRAQTEAAEQRERLRVTLRSIGDAVLATDETGRISYLNPVAEQLTGWTSGEAEGRPLEEVFHIVNEESRLPSENPVAKVLREGGIVGLANHTVLVSRDGREISIDDSAAPIRRLAPAGEGEMIGVVLVFRDITERRSTERVMAAQTAELQRHSELIARAHERLTLALHAGRMGVYDWNLADDRMWWSPEVYSIFGVAPEQCPPGRESLTGLIHPEDRGAFWLRLDQAIAGHRSFFHECRMVLADGTARWIAFRAETEFDPAGNPARHFGVAMDVTQRKRMEQERLELLAQEQTLAAERALREKDAELARISRALTVGELAASIAHEVNQPLAGVVTNAEAGLRWLNGETPNVREARDSLALIVRDGNRASAVIRHIREFLRKGQEETAPVDLNEIIQEALALARSELAKGQAVLRVDLSPILPRVRGDRVQLQQVILNLVMNAHEAMAGIAGRPRELVVGSLPSSDGVLVMVRDSGVGVNQQELRKMFDAFFTTKAKGMGMGLSLSRSIIEAHGGRIWAEPNEAFGLTVQFSLPAESAGEHLSAASSPL